VGVVRIAVTASQARLVDSADDDVGLRQLDAGQEVVEDLDPLRRLHLRAESAGGVKVLSVKLELRIGAAVREVPAPRCSDVLVQGRDLCLVDHEREDQVDRLIGIVEASSRIPCLVHVRKPHPASQPNPLRAREGAPSRLATQSQGAAGSGNHAGGRIGGMCPG
jgi:hypothetical protein